MEYAVALEQIAAQIHALVAGDAAERFEQLIAGKLLRGDRAGIAGKETVEPAARRDERALVCRDRVEQRAAVGLPAIGVAKLPHHVRVGPQLEQDLLDA